MRRPSHATIVAYLALIIAIGTGGAYAIDKVSSQDIRDGSVRSIDLRDGKGVRGRDLKPDSLAGQQIDEASLDASQFLAIAGHSDAVGCDPTGITTACLETTVDLLKPSRLLVVATGGQYTPIGDADGSTARCQIRIDNGDRGISVSPGESGTTSHRGESVNGFARTLITPESLAAGSHQVTLACSELSPDVRIDTPTLAVLAISAG